MNWLKEMWPMIRPTLDNVFLAMVLAAAVFLAYKTLNASHESNAEARQKFEEAGCRIENRVSPSARVDYRVWVCPDKPGEEWLYR